MTAQEVIDGAKVFYFLMESGQLVHVLKYETAKFATYQDHSSLIKRYDIANGKQDMVSMLYDLKKNYSYLGIWPINIKKTEEYYSVTQNDYFKEAVRVAAEE